jgi:hypothetical protein
MMKTDLLTQIVDALRAGEMPLHLAVELDVPGALAAAWDRGAASRIIEIRTFVDGGDILRNVDQREFVQLRDSGPPSLAALLDAIQRNGGKP